MKHPTTNLDIKTCLSGAHEPHHFCWDLSASVNVFFLNYVIHLKSFLQSTYTLSSSLNNSIG